MTLLQIKDETYRRLAERAAAENATVEEYIDVLVDRMTQGSPPQDEKREPTPAERKKALDELLARAEERAERYPPGFEADDSRESIYEGCGE